MVVGLLYALINSYGHFKGGDDDRIYEVTVERKHLYTFIETMDLLHPTLHRHSLRYPREVLDETE